MSRVFKIIVLNSQNAITQTTDRPFYWHMSTFHYNLLTKIQSLLFCSLLIIQLKLTKLAQTFVIDTKK